MDETRAPRWTASRPTAIRTRDALFGIGAFSRDSGQVATTMTIGSWCEGPDGEFSYGSFGVLLDRLVGAAISPGGPAGHWPSTTEIVATFAAAAPTSGETVDAESRIIETRTAGALAEAAIRRRDGTAVALATGRILFTPLAARPVWSSPADLASVAARPARSMLPLVGAMMSPAGAPGTIELPANPVAANPAGNLHGGVALSLAIAAGVASARHGGESLDVSSVHIAFLRPCPSVGIIRFVPAVVHRGRSLAVIHVECFRADGRVSSVSTVSCGRKEVPAAAQ
jgi:uncharacterized protein (TIGR00369 family)